MNPVHKEHIIDKVRALLASDDHLIEQEVDDIRQKIASDSSKKEKQIIFYGISGLAIISSAALLLLQHELHALIPILLWLGFFLYHRIHEKGLIIEHVTMRSQIQPGDIISKINYIQSGISLKKWRLHFLILFASVLVPFAISMIHELLVTSVSLLLWLTITIGLGIISYIFWYGLFKNEINYFSELETNLTDLKYKIALHTNGAKTEEE